VLPTVAVHESAYSDLDKYNRVGMDDIYSS
jgi:hypothetical protein